MLFPRNCRKNRKIFPIKYVLLLLLVLPAPLRIYGQTPEIRWSRTYGGPGNDGIVLNTGWGSVDICGSVRNPKNVVVVFSSDAAGGDIPANQGGADGYIMELDSAGNMLWIKNYGGNNFQEFSYVKATPDKGYLVAGRTGYGYQSGNLNYTMPWGGSYVDWLVMKFDSLGNSQWARKFGSTNTSSALHVETPTSLDMLSDSTFMVTGLVYGGGGIVGNRHRGIFDIMLTRLTLNGDTVYTDIIASSAYDAPAGNNWMAGDSILCIPVTSQGSNYAFSGLGMGPSLDAAIIFYNVYTKQYVIKPLADIGGGQEYGTAGYFNTSQNHHVAGSIINTAFAPSIQGQSRISFFDEQYNLLNEFTVPGSGNNQFTNLIPTCLNTYIFIGQSDNQDSTFYSTGGLDGRIFITDENGNYLDQLRFGGSANEWLGSYYYNPHNNSYYLLGRSSSHDGDLDTNRGGFDLLLLNLVFKPTLVTHDTTYVYVNDQGGYAIQYEDVIDTVRYACILDSVRYTPRDIFCGDTLTVQSIAWAQGLSDTGYTVVIALDTIPPQISCPPDIVQCTPVAEYGPPLVSDNCSAQWTLASGLSSGSFFPPGENMVEYGATDAAGNTTVCSFRIQILDSIHTTAALSPASCTGSADGSAQLHSEGGMAPFAYTWAAGTFSGSYVNTLHAGIYTVYVSDAAGCTDTLEITVTEPAPLLAQTDSIRKNTCGLGDGAIYISVSGGTPPYVYQWDNGAGTEDLEYLQDGLYHLLVSDQNGCPAELSPALSCSLKIIPELLTPNGDGINDTWTIPGLEQYPKASAEIYNRWGNRVFAETPYKNNWEAYSDNKTTIGAERLPAATYYYILDLGDGSTPLKGFIEIQY